MTDLTFVVIREHNQAQTNGESFVLGKVYANGLYFSESCEDQDRFLEKGGSKIKGVTAIPRGRYKLTTSFSHRFKKELPEVQGVDQFSGVRCHGGNKPEDSEGCILIGKVRTRTGIANCADTVQRMIDMINTTEDAGGYCWLEVK